MCILFDVRWFIERLGRTLLMFSFWLKEKQARLMIHMYKSDIIDMLISVS